MLGSLYCFVCAANHLSFTLAAKDLFLTQGAVSSRIKKLEEYLGFKLFLRFNRSIQLTEEGKQLLATLEKSFHSLSTTICDLQNNDCSGDLFLSAPPSFSMSWLTPKLVDFEKMYPRLFIHLFTYDRLYDFSRDNIDIAIYYGSGNYPGLSAQLLMQEYLQPVCSPLYADKHDLYNKPGNMENCRFLHDVCAWPEARKKSEWGYWCRETGLTGFDFKNNYTFDVSYLAALAAINGNGIAMGRHRIIAADLECGKLVTPFNMPIKAQQGYYVVCHPNRVDQPAIKAMLDWLMSFGDINSAKI